MSMLLGRLHRFDESQRMRAKKYRNRQRVSRGRQLFAKQSMENPNSLLSPQQTTPQRMLAGVEGSVSMVHRHLQCEQYNEACKAAREFLATSADAVQVNFLTASFQQTIASVLPFLSENSVATTKSASALLEMLVTLAAYSQDDSFFGIIFSSAPDSSCPSLLLQQVGRVLGCSVNILDSIYQQIQKSGNSSFDKLTQSLGCDILNVCQVRLFVSCISQKCCQLTLFCRFWSNALASIPSFCSA
jgi:hypothetical protein